MSAWRRIAAFAVGAVVVIDLTAARCPGLEHAAKETGAHVAHEVNREAPHIGEEVGKQVGEQR